MDGTRNPSGQFEGAATMAELARFLSASLGEPVLDRTGLTGVYDVKLNFLSEAVEKQLAARGGIPAGAGRGGGRVEEMPDLRTALQEQLGLKLESAKAPVEFLIIESAEEPSEN